MNSDNKPLVNRVANSGLITINLEEYWPSAHAFTDIDITQFLFKELILKEKEFRNELKTKDWAPYHDKTVLIHCSVDAIVPVWAYMLLTSYISSYAKEIFLGTKTQYLEKHYKNIIHNKDWSEFAEKRVVIKGCSNKEVPVSAYMDIMEALQPYAQSIMYGEPCSTVPLFKRPRKLNKT